MYVRVHGSGFVMGSRLARGFRVEGLQEVLGFRVPRPKTLNPKTLNPKRFRTFLRTMQGCTGAGTQMEDKAT